MYRRARLSQISEVRGGYVPAASEARERRRLEEFADPPDLTDGDALPARMLGLQPSAIGPDGTIAWDGLMSVLPVRGAERYAVREGDLLLPLRSQRIQTAVARTVPADVLALGQWALIAPDPEQADACYIAWYLNHPRTRARLAGAMLGSSIQFLTVAAVRDFEIELPDMQTQRRIGRLAALTSHVGSLERRLSDARAALADAVAMTAVERAALRA